jgi:hypothetical protein
VPFWTDPAPAVIAAPAAGIEAIARTPNAGLIITADIPIIDRPQAEGVKTDTANCK